METERPLDREEIVHPVIRKARSEKRLLPTGNAVCFLLGLLTVFRHSRLYRAADPENHVKVCY